jgi:hypothetical protein
VAIGKHVRLWLSILSRVARKKKSEGKRSPEIPQHLSYADRHGAARARVVDANAILGSRSYPRSILLFSH